MCGEPLSDIKPHETTGKYSILTSGLPSTTVTFVPGIADSIEAYSMPVTDIDNDVRGREKSYGGWSSLLLSSLYLFMNIVSSTSSNL